MPRKTNSLTQEATIPQGNPELGQSSTKLQAAGFPGSVQTESLEAVKVYIYSGFTSEAHLVRVLVGGVPALHVAQVPNRSSHSLGRCALLVHPGMLVKSHVVGFAC